MRQYLRENPTDYNIRDAAPFIGRSTGFACKLPAWLARPPKTGAEVQHRSNRRESELTEAILASVGVAADPAELASLREAAWRYLERNAKNDKERGRLRKMTDTEREDMIVSVIEHFDKEIPES